MRWKTSFLLSVILVDLSSKLYAETIEDWIPHTLAIIQKFEGSSPTKVTNDFDLQGISVGTLQWTVASGSFSKLVREAGVKESKTLALKLMKLHGPDFLKVIDFSVSGHHQEARKMTFGLQVMGVDKSTGKPKGVRVKDSAMKELQAWLSSPLLTKAQESLINKLMASTAKVAKDWKTEFGDSTPLTFAEFMFFFNASVQGGLGTFKDGSLGKATKLVRGGKHYVAGGDLSVRRKMLVGYLADWLSIEWPQAKNKLYFSDSKKNAVLLRKHSKKLTPTQIHLLYMKYVRASVGNTPYHLPFMNRGVIDILGEGWVNQTHFDFSQQYSGRTPLKN